MRKTIKAQPEQTKTIKELGNAINMMDCLSSIGFSEIASIAKLALLTLETPEGYRHISDIAFALESIRSKAQDMENLINCEAESTGFNHIDDAWHRRISAEATFRNTEGVQA